MKQNWHTLLDTPNVLEPVTVEVPPEDSACLFFPPSGQPFADVDIDYFAGQLETILELENVDPTQLSIMLTKDIVLYEGGNIFNCCVIGFHSAGAVLGVVGNPAQTFAWASWLLPADGFGGGLEDILPLSHEIGEWANDPYTNNIVPAWQEPDGSGNCGGNLLEVAIRSRSSYHRHSRPCWTGMFIIRKHWLYCSGSAAKRPLVQLMVPTATATRAS